MADIVEIGYRADTTDLRSADRDMKRLVDTGGKLDNSLATLTRSVGNLAAVYLSLSSVTNAIKTTSDFSQAVANLSSITGASGKNLEYYKQQAAEIGRTTTLSASQAVEAYQLIASASPQLLKNAQALNAVTREAVVLAEATGQDLPTSAKALGSALNQFQLDASKASEVINVLAASSQLGTAQVAQVTEALRNAGPAAQALGVDFAEAVAGIQALAAAGREGSDAGTALRQVMLRLERTGDSTLMPSVVGLTKAMEELASRQMSNQQLMKLFGDEAFSAATSILGQRQVLSELNQTLRGTNTAYEQQSTRVNTFAGDLKGLSSALEGLQLEVFSDSVDGLGRNLIQSATTGVNALTENLDSLVNVVGAFSLVYSGKLLGSLVQGQAVKAKDTLATIAQSKATASAAAAEANYLRVVQSSLVAQLKSSTITTQQIALRKQLALNTTALTAAQMRANTAMGIGTLAARGLAGAMALVGGPIGLILTAVGGLTYVMATNSKEMETQEERAKRLAGELDNLAESYGALTSQQLQAEYRAQSMKAFVVIPAEIAEAERKLAEATRTLNQERSKLRSLGRGQAEYGDTEAAREAREVIDRLSITLQRLNDEKQLSEAAVAELGDALAALGEAGSKTGSELQGVSDSTSGMSDSFSGIVSSLTEQIIELRDGSEAAEEFALMQRLGSEASVAQKNAIMGLLSTLRKLKAENKSAKETKDTYVELLGLYDKNQAAKNQYGEEVKRIISANLSEAETVKLLEMAYQKLQETQKNQGMDLGIDKLIEDVDNFGGAWTRVGSAVADAAGSIISHLDDYEAKMKGIQELQGRAIKLRDEEGASTEQVSKANEVLAELQQESYSSQINSIGTIMGAASQMFEEQSSARRKLHQMELVFTAIETAMALKKAVANAVSSITNQGSGDPYTAFARVAAMGALMAGVLSQAGVAFGSTSGGYDAQEIQETQGTGTLLGSADDKSESILNAVEITAEANLDQIVELRALRSSMQQLSDGIANLAVTLVQSSKFGSQFASTGSSQNLSGVVNLLGDIGFGGLLGGFMDSIIGGLFGSVERELVDYGISFDTQSLAQVLANGILQASYYNVIEVTEDYLWGLISDTDTETEYSEVEDAILRQFGQIFGFIGDSVLRAIESLGLSMSGSLESFVIDLGEISFEGMSGDEIQSELEAIFSQQADLIVEHLIPSMANYQQMGEGLFETLIRVANEQAQFNSAIERMGFNLSELSAIMRVDIAQAIIEMMGGLEKFSDATSTYFNEFYSETEQMEALGGQLNRAFEELGLQLPTTRDGFRALVDSLDITTEYGQRMFAALMELAPWMAEYIDMLHEQGLSVQALSEGAISALDDVRNAISAEKELARERLDSARALYDAEVDRVNGLIQTLEEAKRVADEALASAETSLRASFDAEIERQRELSQERIASLQEEISATRELQQAAQDLLAFAQDKLRGAFEAEISNIEEINRERNQGLRDEIEAVRSMSREASEFLRKAEADVRNSFNRQIEVIRSTLRSELDLISERQRANDEAIGSSRDLISSLSGLSQNLKSTIGSIAEQSSRLTLLRRRQTQQAIQDAILLAKAGDFSSAMELDFSSLSNTSGIFQSAEERAYDVAKTQQALLELSGLTDERLTTEELIVSELESQNQLLESQAEQLRAQAEQQITALQSQLEAILNLDSSVLSIGEAINQLREAQASQQDFDGLIQSLENQIAENDAQAANQIASLEAQLNTLLGIDTSVLSIADAISLWQEAQAEQQDFEGIISGIEAQIESERVSLEETLNALREQRDAILGIDNTVLSIAESTERYRQAKQALDELDYENSMALYQQMLDSAAEVYELHRQAYEEEIARLDAILEDAEAQLESLGLINNSVLSVEEAINQLGLSIESYLEAMQRAEEERDREVNPPSVEPEEPPIFDPGAPLPPPPGPGPGPRPGYPPIDEVIKPLSGEVSELREELTNAQKAIAKSTAQTAKALQRIELGGLDVRNVT